MLFDTLQAFELSPGLRRLGVARSVERVRGRTGLVWMLVFDMLKQFLRRGTESDNCSMGISRVFRVEGSR